MTDSDNNLRPVKAKRVLAGNPVMMSNTKTGQIIISFRFLLFMTFCIIMMIAASLLNSGYHSYVETVVSGSLPGQVAYTVDLFVTPVWYVVGLVLMVLSAAGLLFFEFKQRAVQRTSNMLQFFSVTVLILAVFTFTPPSNNVTYSTAYVAKSANFVLENKNPTLVADESGKETLTYDVKLGLSSQTLTVTEQADGSYLFVFSVPPLPVEPEPDEENLVQEV